MQSVQLVRCASEFSLSDHALHYGHGVFETIPFIGMADVGMAEKAPTEQRLLLFDAHFERLMLGAQRLGIQCLQDEVKSLILQQVAAICNEPAIVKVILSAGPACRGYQGYWREQAHCVQAQLIVMVEAISPEYGQNLRRLRSQGCALIVCQQRLAIQPALAGIKHLNRLEQVLASREVVHHNVDEGILLDTSECMISATAGNLFWVQDQQIFTPMVAKSGIRGVFRETLIACAQQLHWSVTEVEKPLSALWQAKEVFICNAIRGIWPVTRIDKVDFAIGPMTQQLQKHTKAWTFFG